MADIIPNDAFNITVFDTPSTMKDDEKAKVREYAKLQKLRENLNQQQRKLDQMMELIGADWCKKFLWVNGKGDVIPVFDLDDDYLRNIISWCTRNNKEVPKQVRKEFVSRFGFDALPHSDGEQYAPRKAKDNYFTSEF